MGGGDIYARADLSGKVALITGASRGLGRAFACALAIAGAAVAISASTESDLIEPERELKNRGKRVFAIAMDVANPEAVARATAAVEKRLGPVDILVNNAGVMSPIGLDWEVDFRAWWRTFEVNSFGAFLCARAVLPGMIRRHNGRIINVSSGAAHTCHTYASAYGASKAALTKWTAALAGATKEHGVAVLAYAPGLVRTAMTELLAESPDARRWIGDVFKKRFDQGTDTPVEKAVEQFMLLASGYADSLSGRHLSVSDDIAELVRRAQQIQQRDLYTLKLGTLDGNV